MILTGYACSTWANTFPKDTHYRVCFTPGQNCVAELVKQINKAKQSIYVQAYAFTDHKIGNALARAQRRGVKVSIIFDKSNFQPGAHTSAHFLMHRHIPAWNDNTLNIAHNKIMIFDKKIVETGSFNYTWSAEHKNAENMIFIENKKLAKLYLNNWFRRKAVSQPMDTEAKIS